MKKLMMTAAVGAIVLTACNKDPEVSFTADKTTVKRGEAVTFTNSSLEKKVYDFEWNFGDGTENSSTYNAAHTYSNEGAYVVTLSGASKKRNKFATATATVTVTHEWIGTQPEALIDQNNDRAYNEARTKWYNDRVGTWKTSVVSLSKPDCSGATSGTSRSGNADALNVTFEFLQNGTLVVTDHNGNVMTGGSFSYVDDTHVSVSGIGSINFPYEVDASGNENSFNLVSGIYAVTAGSMDLVRTVKSSNVNGTSKCIDTDVYTLTLVKQ